MKEARLILEGIIQLQEMLFTDYMVIVVKTEEKLHNMNQ